MGGGAASGVMGAMIAGHCAQGQWLKSRVKPINPNSTFQHPTRNALRQLAVQWGTLLTGTQRTAWATYAANVTWTNRLGDTVHLSGQMEFIRSNIVRGQANLPFVLDAPVIFDRGVVGTPPPFTTAAGSPTGTVSISGAAPWLDGNVNTAMLVYIGLPRNVGVNFFRRRSRIAAVIRAPAAPVNFSFTLQYGIPASFQQKWPAWVAVTTADGRLTTPVPLTTFDTGPLPPGPWIEPFTYPNGNLPGNAQWAIDGTTPNEIQVNGNKIQADAGAVSGAITTSPRLPLDWTIPWELTCDIIFNTGDDGGCEFTVNLGDVLGAPVSAGIQRVSGDAAANQISNVNANDGNGNSAGPVLVTGVTGANHTFAARWTGTRIQVDIDGTTVIDFAAAPITTGQTLEVNMDDIGGTDNLQLDNFDLTQ